MDNRKNVANWFDGELDESCWSVKDNPALVAMMERAMQRMTIESMLMQAGASEEDIKQLNRVLQGIAKE